MTAPTPGEFRMYERFDPALKQGMHQIGLTMELPSELGLGSSEGCVSSSRHMEVTGPRWKIPLEDIHSMRPGINQQDADVDCVLPMFVSGRRTLPWERALDPVDNAHEDSPWIALLLFTEDELMRGGELGVFKGDKALKLFGQVNGHAGIFDHKTGDSAFLTAMGLDRTGIHANFKVDAIEVREDILFDVTPYRIELPLLVHAREVNTADKELCGEDEDGWFSVLCCNRLPTEVDTVYHACVVSLEGRTGESWYPAPSLRQRCDSDDFTSLILLHHWSFKTNDTGGDFSSRMEALRLRIRESNDSNHRSGSLAPRSEVFDNEQIILEPYILGNRSIPGVGETGHILLDQVDETGEVNPVIYRGPFSPVKTYPIVRDSPYQDADAARKWMNDLGMEDISLASAFELGRLLALSDSGFLRDMARWRREQDERDRIQLSLENLQLKYSLGDFDIAGVHEVQQLTRELMFRDVESLTVQVSPILAALKSAVSGAFPVDPLPDARIAGGAGAIDGPGMVDSPDLPKFESELPDSMDISPMDMDDFSPTDWDSEGGGPE